ncbi:LOW QUALITY PROTEIN: uncharacterized protein LOC103966915 [Pyrus x bretschneideri]|uniref:LOW QUALITY PROTEIN: uncharacterized protein LOC103966915 n=1 Tax=Pyrus x bretschneideri TaxID=225117 RepID=UPI00202F6AC9|nr:LOW QUALITY PROTEIN: uncharacterized protein LOC103966915 [Pyrus x bretschneideri]
MHIVPRIASPSPIPLLHPGLSSLLIEPALRHAVSGFLSSFPRVLFTSQCRRCSESLLGEAETGRLGFQSRASVAKRLIVDFGNVNEESRARKAVGHTRSKTHSHMADYYICKYINMLQSWMTLTVNKSMLNSSLYINYRTGQSSLGLNSVDHVEDQTEGTNTIVETKVNRLVMDCVIGLESVLPIMVSDDLVFYEGADIHETDCSGNLSLEEMKENNISPVMDENVNGSCKVTNVGLVEDERVVGGEEEELLVASRSPNGEIENFSQTNIALYDMLPRRKVKRLRKADCEDMMPLNKKQTRRHETKTISSATEFSVLQKQLLMPSSKMKAVDKDKMAPRLQSHNLEHDQAVATPKENQKCETNQKPIILVQKSKRNCDDVHINERNGRHKSVSLKDQPEKKEFPIFESYIVEEEEGSGGYGTVYRARTKNDEKKVAIKRPHANAHKNHVNNELRMLEKFGGKNFVIKYEGRIKNENSSCFVLQHVEHDRPEVLKQEIGLSHLHWYGYCLFKALASLHRQGVVHRDVKPGNFLFSRKANKGYLIDFNLATDLHMKPGTRKLSSLPCKLKSGYDYDEKLTNAKSVPRTPLQKLPTATSLVIANGETKKVSNPLDPRDLKKKALSQIKPYNSSGGRSLIKSQGADGSGITSVKDVSNIRTPPVERLREPVPSQGRKELINLVQEAMQNQNHISSGVSAPMRKRIPAPPGNEDDKLFYITPMPLHLTGNGVGGADLIRSRGGGKQKKEGPCAGTKGYRAPEVLLRSPYQGPKLDIWSAGVTLLYFMIGRTPFGGDPEQNIKDIAKLRGSEDLWEVAKLHDRESSFPAGLYCTESLPSIKLQDWCRRSTKRLDFYNEIPRPLFDLVDKCLAVNPRVRISAEEALRHEFFAPCHEELRKLRLQRQVL